MAVRECRVWIICMLLSAGCTAFQVAGQVQSGRGALLINQPEHALPYFQEAAQNHPDYIFHEQQFGESVWTYLGRTQYMLGRLPEARQSLERALSVYKDDVLARIYLGLTLIRSDDRSRGLKELESGLRALHELLDYLNASDPLGAFWDPTREMRKEIDNDLGMISTRDIDWQKLIASGEWVGRRMEDEIDKVRRDKEERRRRNFDGRSGVSLGIGMGF
jgi:tetratricopeptide (TPR) repeat protein